ncbi:MAG: hypothetical protein VKJ09_14025 [Leptolyngbya sp.]|nr:hypothetical protein [Leptolyngbya sp.]
MAPVGLSKIAALGRTLLRNPTWLAGAISLGFHGVLFAASPTFTSLNLNGLAEPDPEAGDRQVPLVELTAAEQQRLPDFSNSFYSVSPWDGNLGLEPVPGEAPLGNPFPQDDTVAGSSITRVDPGGVGRQSWPLAGGYPNPRQQGGKTEANPSGNATGGSPAPGGNRGGATGGTTTIPTDSDGSSDQAAGQRPNTAPPPANEPGAADLTRQPNSPAAGSDPSRGEALIAALTYDGGAPETVREDWETDAIARLGGNELALQQVELPISALVNGTLPCLAPAPQTGLIAALVADGKLATDPELLISTGYPLLNQRAIDRVKSLNFSNVDRAMAYQFIVQVAYQADVCVDLSDLKLDADRPSTPTEKSTPVDETDGAS